MQIRSAVEIANVGIAKGVTDEFKDGVLRLTGITGVNPDGTMIILIPELRSDIDPSYVNARLLIWGHELAHIVCGPSWHQ